MRKRWPAGALRAAPTLQNLAVGGILFVFVLVIVDNPAAFASGLLTNVPLAIVFVAASVAAGWITAALITRDVRDCFAIASGFGARNVGVATAIAVTILGRLDFARFAATYALIEVPLKFGVVALFRRFQARRI